jgi:hypothetical protein
VEYFDITVFNPDRVDGCFGGEKFRIAVAAQESLGLDAGKHVPCILHSADICQTRHSIRKYAGTVLPTGSPSGTVFRSN